MSAEAGAEGPDSARQKSVTVAALLGLALFVVPPASFITDTASKCAYLTPPGETLWAAIVLPAGDRPEEVTYSEDGVFFKELEFIPRAMGDTVRLDFPPTAARMFCVRYDRPPPYAPPELEPAGPVAFSVSDVRIAAYEDRAVIRWKTNLPTGSSVLYAPIGWSRDRLRRAGQESFEVSTEHEIEVRNLLPGTDYYFYIEAGPEVFGRTHEEPFRFRTEGIPLPHAAERSLDIGTETVVFRFRSNIPAKPTLVLLGEGGFEKRLSGPMGVEHILRAEGLEPRAEYRYRLVWEDKAGRVLEEAEESFRTLGDNIALGRPVEGTFNALLVPDQLEGETPPIRRATDGRDDYFTGMATSGDPAETYQWITVDLGRLVPLRTIEVVWRGNACPLQFFVLAGADTENWIYPTLALSAADGAFERSSRGDPLYRVVVPMEAFPPVRFVQVFVPRGAPIRTKLPSWRFVQLAEVEAYPRR